MIYKIYNQDSRILLEMQETGMGYQIVKANSSSGFRKMVVYNSDLAVDLDDYFVKNKNRITTEGYTKMFSNVNVEALMLETDTIRVLNKSELEEINFVQETRTFYEKLSNNGATDNPKQNADGKEIFVRLSAYEDDKRIDFKNRCLKPGSFTTTFDDYCKCVSNNYNPIDRYALPSDEEIEWAFRIQPKKEDELQRGIVQPAFGKNGGGVEAYFENGTSEETYLKQRRYGK